jgi:hypothetical protein
MDYTVAPPDPHLWVLDAHNMLPLHVVIAVECLTWQEAHVQVVEVSLTNMACMTSEVTQAGFPYLCEQPQHAHHGQAPMLDLLLLEPVGRTLTLNDALHSATNQPHSTASM